MFGAEKIDAGGTDIARDQSNRVFLWHPANRAKPKRKLQGSAGMLTLLGMDSHGMSGHADEAPRLGRAKQRNHTQRRSSWRLGNGLRSRRAFARLCGGFWGPPLQAKSPAPPGPFSPPGNNIKTGASPPTTTPSLCISDVPPPTLSLPVTTTYL